MPSPRSLDVPALLVAMAIAALAGATDVYGLIRLHDLFVSFMSGNTTSMAIALANLDTARVALIAGILAMFVAGAAAGTALGEWAEPYHAAAVMAAVAFVLTIPLLHDPWTVPALTFAMGALNASMAQIGTTSIGLTYVTGAMVKFGSGIGRWAIGVKEKRDWLLHAPIWLSLFGGGVLGAIVRHQLGPRGYWPLPLCAALLVPSLWIWKRRER